MNTLEENCPYNWGTDLDYASIASGGTGGFWGGSFYDFSGMVIKDYTDYMLTVNGPQQ